ncbi:pupal cuticle protein C1B-like [Uranotaenia lowii]|uniref:pupal cuticle protein C1B-like n=1 Tax=Uranotaenia lowii TaxID=190385 RepID=UPI00247B02C2|nr:pupal cuticle protein C1B-like [Uranotaenia lowii]
MFAKTIVLALFAVVAVSAKPGLVAPVAYSAPLVAAAPAPFVTAQSSQYIARNYNGIAPVAYTAAYTSALATPLAYTAPAVAAAYTAPLAAAAYTAPFGAAYTAPVLL